MKLKKLFNLRSDGSPQEWTIEYIGNKFRTISGKVGGKLVESAWTTVVEKNTGKKNQTTGEEQAKKEAIAKWEKKVAKGYKEDIKDIAVETYIKPMLAENYKDYADLVFPVFTQPKLDGIRCIESEIGPRSREGKVFVGCPHIHEQLQVLFDNNPGIIFDGELYADKYAKDFNKIVSIVKKGKPTAEDIQFAKDNMEYWIYDIIDSKMKFSERSDTLLKLKSLFGPSIKLVPTIKIHNQKKLDHWYAKWMEEGYEGQMIRIDAEYQNKRSKYLLKRKEFQDDEFTILDVLEGKGNRAGMAGKFLVQVKKGVTSECNIKGGFEYYKKLLKNKEDIIGKKVTVKFFGFTPAGKLRFGVAKAFRDYE